MSGAPALTALTGHARNAAGADGFGPSEHACWGYSSDAARVRAACEWLTDGLRQGYRAVYIADASADDIVAELAAIPDRDAKLAGRALVVVSTGDLYDLSAPIDAPAQLAVYNRAVEQAIRDGYRGLRVAADITVLIEDPARRPAHIHWEQVADRYISQRPLAPLCMYDRRRVSDIDAVAGCHPLHGPAAVPFALYAAQPHGAAAAGEIDLASHDTFRDVLTGQPESDRVIDMSGLTFLDARAAWLLHSHLVDRRAAGHPVVLTDASPLVRRVWDVAGFDSGFLG